MPTPVASSRKRRATEPVKVDAKDILCTPAVQGRIKRARKERSARATADKEAAEKKAKMVVGMCTRLCRSGHRNLARVLQAALSEEPEIKAEGVSTRVEALEP